VRRLLRRKGFAGAAIAGAVERLSDLGYVDDARYAASFIVTVATTRLWGPHRVRRELAKRGVPRSVIDAEMARAEAGGPSPEAEIDRAVEKAVRQRGFPTDRKGRDRLKAALHRRGYSGAEIVRAVRRYQAKGEEPGEEA